MINKYRITLGDQKEFTVEVSSMDEAIDIAVSEAERLGLSDEEKRVENLDEGLIYTV